MCALEAGSKSVGMRFESTTAMHGGSKLRHDLKASIWLQIGHRILLVDKQVKAMDHTTL